MKITCYEYYPGNKSRRELTDLPGSVYEMLAYHVRNNIKLRRISFHRDGRVEYITDAPYYWEADKIIDENNDLSMMRLQDIDYFIHKVENLGNGEIRFDLILSCRDVTII